MEAKQEKDFKGIMPIWDKRLALWLAMVNSWTNLLYSCAALLGFMNKLKAMKLCFVEDRSSRLIPISNWNVDSHQTCYLGQTCHTQNEKKS